MLHYSELKTKPRAFLAMTGLTVAEFEILHGAFATAYSTLYPADRNWAGQVRKRQAGAGAKGTLEHSTDKLLFILMYHKTNPLQTAHGLQFGLSQGQANYWIHRLLPVLQRALADLHLTPERQGEDVAESALVREGGPDLLLDGTERRRQRPKDPVRQREHYSGKKKAHTDKNLVLVNEHNGEVVYLGATHPGKMHDKKAADAADLSFPAGTVLSQDTGFQGFAPPGVVIQQPKKSHAARS
jgi:hypothetical protein